MDIILNNVSKTLNKSVILNEINYHFKSGFIYGIKGSNGSGKTMMLKLISGLLRPTSGEIKISNKILYKDIDFPESIGILIENPAFMPNLTGLKNLKCISLIKDKIKTEEIYNIMLDIGLDPNDKRHFKKYSLGMKQKLGIACAFMENPDIIILDEPTNALDSESVNKLKELILKYKDNNRIILIAVHENYEIETLCDKFIYLKDGSLTNEI